MDSGKSWQRLLVSLLIALVANVGIWSVVVVLPSIEAEFNSSRGVAALPYTLTLLGFAIGNFFIGYLVDRFGITKSLIFASLLISSNFLFCALSSSLFSIIFSHFFLGLGTAAGFGPLIADISHWFSKKRGIAVAIIASGNYLSGVIWSPVIANILSDDGWRNIYLTLSLVICVVVIPLSFYLYEKTKEVRPAAQKIKNYIQTTKTAISGRQLQFFLGLAGVGCCIAMAMPQVHIVAYCVGLGYGPTIGAEMLSLMLACGVISRISFGICADRLGGFYTLILSSTLQMLSLFLFFPFNGMVSLYIVSAIFGLSQGGIVPSYTIVVREFLPAHEAGQRIGIVLMLTIFGMDIGGWMSGWIFDQTGSYQIAFLNGILWNVFNLTILVWLLIRMRRAYTISQK
jgi:MFS family permease